MNTRVDVTQEARLGADRFAGIVKRWMVIAVVVLAATLPLTAQSPELQEKLAAVKQTAGQNKQRLQQYQWTETIQLTLKGDEKPATRNLCQYGADGQIIKTPIGAPPPPPSGGRLKKKVIANKKAEMKDYMGDVKVLLSQYVPPDPQKMEQAFKAGKLSVNPAGSIVNFIFRDYAQAGDQMTLAFDPAKKAILSLSINTYLGQEKDAVTLQVRMASLPDGTSYAGQTVLNATAKQLVVTTTNSNYQKLGG